ncbi:hypothetical protein [Clostridium tertium]|uniref:hypothetical protein n=1 Tax=Clostridium tertium TaxID=1559 RepID=UPI002A8089AC|nr:hypothetical protein [Clostridium tertium]MDY4606870.1 hypothetical protein [Clostridium tertium]
MGKLMQEILKRDAYKKKLAKIENDIELDMSKEVDLLMREGLSYQAALRQVKEMYEKAHSLTDQSIENESMKPLQNIITDKEDIDNNEIYDIESGQTISEL